MVVVSMMTEKFSIQTQKRSGHAVHRKNQNIVENFLNTIRKFVSPPSHPSQHLENETYKGLDFKIPGAKNKVAPNYGNNQDLQLIYLGTKW